MLVSHRDKGRKEEFSLKIILFSLFLSFSLCETTFKGAKVIKEVGKRRDD
jgi:hypothetical protein